MALRGKYNNQINSRRAREALSGGLYEGSFEDKKKDKRLAKKYGMTEEEFENSPEDKKLDRLGQIRLDAKLKKKKVKDT